MSDTMRFGAVSLTTVDLLGEDSWLAKIQKAPDDELAQSRQGSLKGRQQHLIDYAAVALLREHNVHHSAAIEAKVSSTTGLGHRDPKINEVLNPLCRVSWQETRDAAVDDAFEFGNGYLEIVRNEQGQIRGIHHLPTCDVWVSVEDGINDFHYEIRSKGDVLGAQLGGEILNGLRFARFGERDELIERLGIEDEDKKALVSEVIHFAINRGKKSPHYGMVDWISAIPAMESDSCLVQYEFDFFFNGGVPEGIYSVIGKKMDDDDWDELKKQFQAHIGPGKRRKLMLLNLHDEGMRAQLDRLTLDGQTVGDNQQLSDRNALKVVSGHRVPPMLVGIQLPGKMGAANEFTNALMGFQLLVIGKVQKGISQILGCTLGNPELNGDLGLTEDQFLGVGMGKPGFDDADPTGVEMEPQDTKGNGFNTILDEFDLGQMETVSRMRMSTAEADARGRDLGAGVAERGGDVEAGRGAGA